MQEYLECIWRGKDEKGIDENCVFWKSFSIDLSITYVFVSNCTKFEC